MHLLLTKISKGFSSVFGRLQSIPHDDPDLTPETWCREQPCMKIRIASREMIISQPFSSFWVYFLGFLTVGAGLYFFQIQNGQNSRLWWGVSLLLWGIGALLAGTSYQAFGYEISAYPNEPQDFDEVRPIVEGVAGVEAVYPGVATQVGLEGYTDALSGTSQFSVTGFDTNTATFDLDYEAGTGWDDDPNREGIVLSSGVADQLEKGVGDSVVLSAAGQTAGAAGVDQHGAAVAPVGLRRGQGRGSALLLPWRPGVVRGLGLPAGPAQGRAPDGWQHHHPAAGQEPLSLCRAHPAAQAAGGGAGQAPGAGSEQGAHPRALPQRGGVGARDLGRDQRL